MPNKSSGLPGDRESRLLHPYILLDERRNISARPEGHRPTHPRNAHPPRTDRECPAASHLQERGRVQAFRLGFPDTSPPSVIHIKNAGGPTGYYRDCVASRQSAKVTRLEIIRYHNIG